MQNDLQWMSSIQSHILLAHFQYPDSKNRNEYPVDLDICISSSNQCTMYRTGFQMHIVKTGFEGILCIYKLYCFMYIINFTQLLQSVMVIVLLSHCIMLHTNSISSQDLTGQSNVVHTLWHIPLLVGGRLCELSPLILVLGLPLLPFCLLLCPLFVWGIVSSAGALSPLSWEVRLG